MKMKSDSAPTIMELCHDDPPLSLGYLLANLCHVKLIQNGSGVVSGDPVNRFLKRRRIIEKPRNIVQFLFSGRGLQVF